MTKSFYVYEVENRNIPYIADSPLPEVWIREIRKYKKGRESKVEAIYRTIGKRLDPSIKGKDIDDFIGSKLYNTSQWLKYLKYRQDIENEVHIVELKTKLIYILKIDTNAEITATNLKLLPENHRG